MLVPTVWKFWPFTSPLPLLPYHLKCVRNTSLAYKFLHYEHFKGPSQKIFSNFFHHIFITKRVFLNLEAKYQHIVSRRGTTKKNCVGDPYVLYIFFFRIFIASGICSKMRKTIGEWIILFIIDKTLFQYSWIFVSLSLNLFETGVLLSLSRWCLYIVKKKEVNKGYSRISIVFWARRRIWRNLPQKVHHNEKKFWTPTWLLSGGGSKTRFLNFIFYFIAKCSWKYRVF